MWVVFVYDSQFQCQGWRKALSPEQSGVTEVPDHVVRRWDLIYELFCECQIEAGEWKARGMHPATRALPTRITPLEVLDAPMVSGS